MQRMDGTRWIVVSLVLGLLLWSMVSVADFNGISQRSIESISEPERGGMLIGGTPHAPIIINGDVNFNATVLAEGWPGDGSHENPYIIEGLDIDRGGTSDDCVNISNTRVHFIVRNCILTGANVSGGSGLHLNNVTNGEIIYNVCTNNTLGIYLDQSSSNTIVNNTCTNNSYGLILISSNNSMIANNTCTKNDNYGIIFSSSSSNTMTNNICGSNNDGIHLGTFSNNNKIANNTCSNNNGGIIFGSSSSNNTVTNNTCNSNNYGIAIASSSNHTMIVNNTCNDNLLYGIYVLLSSFNAVVNNTCSNNTQYGTFIEAGYSNTVVNNTCSNNQFGVMLTSGINGTVANNICTNNYDSGIHLLHSSSNTVVNNTCSNNTQYGIFIESSNFNTVSNNTCSSNQFGISFLSSNNNNASNNIFTNNYDSGIQFLMFSSNNVVVDNTCSSNTQYGIFIDSSSFNTVSNNTCSSNNYGIFLITANSNTMINNTFNSNDYGIFVTISSFNILTNNTCSNNQYGIYLFADTDDNDLQWNVFTDNSFFNGYDDGTNNIFDYNYWSDYVGTDVDLDGFGDTAYVFLANSDPHPLMYLPTPPSWTSLPVDQTVEFGQPFRYELPFTSPSPLTLWWNDTLFHVDNQGVVTSRAILFIDTYVLRVVVTNIYGSRLTATFRVNVLDNTSPDWLIIPTDQTLSYGEEFDYQIAVIDISGIDHWELSDTVHFTFTAAHYSIGSTARITNITALEAGVYSLEIRVYDMYDNNCSATIIVTILESMTTVTTTTTTPTTIQPEEDSTLVIVAGVGIIGATAILVILVWLQKRGGE